MTGADTEMFVIHVSTGAVSKLIEVLPSDRISKLKRKIESMLGVPCAQQKLMYSENPMRSRMCELDDSRTLAECKIGGGAMLHVQRGDVVSADV
eukprot:6205834-Pleurochrysis_carterae.AAC.1